MGEHGESVAADGGGLVPEASVHLRRPRFEVVWEPEGEIAGCHDQVGANDRILTLLQNGEEKLKPI